MPGLLEVCDYGGSYPGSFVPAIVAVGTAARERLGLQPHCLIPEGVADRPWVRLLDDAGIRWSTLPATASRRERLGLVRAAARDADARVLRSHFTGWDLETALAARLTGARSVWHVHTGLGATGPRQRAADLVKVRGLGRVACDRVIAVSELIRRETIARGLPADRVRLVSNGIDTDRFAPARLPDRGAARAVLGLAADARVVLAYAWMPHLKGADVLLDAGERAARAGRELTVCLVGWDALEAVVAERYGAARPGWLRVIAPADDPRELLAAADVFVSASRWEAFSFAIGEAMAAGLPVVSSAIDGPSVFFGAAGVSTYPVERHDALLDATDSALTTDRDAAGAANRAFVEAHLSLDRHVDGVLDVFADLR